MFWFWLKSFVTLSEVYHELVFVYHYLLSFKVDHFDWLHGSFRTNSGIGVHFLKFIHIVYFLQILLDVSVAMISFKNNL